jgi:hypothetical protein
MGLINTKEIREIAGLKKARGNIACKFGRIISREERARRQAKAENTPNLDKLLATV